ncbi:flagellar basal body rod protein FlgG [Paenibacillus larvae]|uniref:Flagellar hook protein FlgE n=3 Tax=Paenibacillus larvae TaxID=1464 RepID=V9W732_9BACL|nr:flagellar basal body rod protein FlgG [Paenibacillus larvae]AHD05953.1 flagellar basal-body rod protein FlgG [Paenibacillus larvae subsp. larvae DSM 25430]AQR76604.1 flagellar basal body rod protein FlgG [Paenibacillus larvae subsp. larvae]AQT83641.1 flagellar basal body rod protein FlgG [Paenibacillus larvae subsp. pulvifaciens]AQZ48778.1 flagellar basal body rod protein FlgG [Paenibacillus larvae subsp. pulvifaciens]AVF22541.1 flagellar basal-body rod protein FlgG [Paenibacillus larvae su
MLRSMYSGISGMRGFQTKLDVIGNNIANVNTIGFKGSRVMFQDLMSQTIRGATGPTDTQGGVNGQQIGLGSTVASIDTLHTNTGAMNTYVKTDMRIEGDGYFAVKTSSESDTYYLTRAGNFKVDAQRRLVTADGMLVLNSDGDPIEFSENMTDYSFGADGTITQILKGGEKETIGQIGVVKVTNPSGLMKVGGNLFELTPNAHDGDPGISTPKNAETGTGTLMTGSLEMSNVDLTSEFTEMIVAQRGFQANSRIITTSDEVLQEVVNLKR